MENYWQWRLTSKFKRLKLKVGVVPHRFECQKKTLLPQIERKGALKRKRIALVQEALSAAAISSVEASTSVSPTCDEEPSTSTFDKDSAKDKGVQMYSIVYFRDGLELIPTKWRTEDNQSFYPPYSSFSRIENAIELMENPEPSWKTYAIKHVFGTAATYEEGMEILEAAMKVSEIKIEYESDEEKQKQAYEDTEGESKAKKQKTTSENDSNLDDEYSHSSLNPPELPSHKHQPTIICATPQSSSLHSSGEEINSDDDFKNFMKKSVEEIFRKLNRLEEKLDALQEIVADSNKTSSETELLTDEEDIFPLSSIEKLNNLERELEDVTFFKKMVNILKRIGGHDNYTVVVGALKKVLSNEVAEEYSLAGAKKKRRFKDLILFKLLLETARCHRHNLTEVEFSEIVARWLVQAKLRRLRDAGRKRRLSND